MNFKPIMRLADALLYEGYMLYPYRPSALKNHWRWTVGGLFPLAYEQAAPHPEPASLRAECLLRGGAPTRLDVRARFLQLGERAEAVERNVAAAALELGELAQRALRCGFSFSASRTIEGTLEVSAEPLGEGLYRLRVRLDNLTPLPDAAACSREQALPFSLLSCHLLFGVVNGEFISLLDPGAERNKALACRNEGVWPVLVGAPGQRDRMMAAPIILYDYPQIASQSGGDLFDATEMDEMLTLRIRTLTPREKTEMAATDSRTADLLRRSESLPDDALRTLHGAWRRDDAAAVELRPGMRVRLRPSGRADVFDLALAGKIAEVVAVDTDFEDRTHVSVVLDDDPGKDLGLAGWPGHRFFFRPDELEPAPNAPAPGG
jgi:hypothetical protein